MTGTGQRDDSRRPSSLTAVILTDDDSVYGALDDLFAPCGVQARRTMGDSEGTDLAILVDAAEARDSAEAVRRLRGEGARVVAVMANHDPGFVVDLYRAGADVVFDRQVDPHHLFLQSCSLLKIWRPDSRPGLVGEARFEAENRRLLLPDGASVHLTEAESGILSLLIEAGSGFVSRDVISRTVFRITYDRFDRRIDVHVSNLRRKLRENAVGAQIETSRLNGFRLRPDSAEAGTGA